MPDQENIFNEINDKVLITRPNIVVAKEYIFNEFRTNRINKASHLLKKFLLSVNANSPVKIIIHFSVDSTSSINQAINYISWTLAFSEALWSLIRNNFLIPLDGTVRSEEPNLEWTTVVPGSGGNSSGWSFPLWKYSLPDEISIAPSMTNISLDYLIEPDLFLKNLNIENLHPKVSEALIDTILCFRAELYTPSLAMLLRAVEGAWQIVGFALLNSIDENKPEKFKKQADVLSSDFSSVARIVRTVIEIYEHQDLFGEISRRSKVKLEDLKFEMIWADTVRESRNALHFGYESMIPNDFEKVATLLLGAPNHFKTLYRIIDIASNHTEF